MLVIGIAGGTGSGKTTVVRKIIESLPEGEVAILSQDSYYKDLTHMKLEERAIQNFDHPDAIDIKLFNEQISALAYSDDFSFEIYYR